MVGALEGQRRRRVDAPARRIRRLARGAEAGGECRQRLAPLTVHVSDHVRAPRAVPSRPSCMCVPERGQLDMMRATRPRPISGERVHKPAPVRGERDRGVHGKHRIALWPRARLAADGVVHGQRCCMLRGIGDVCENVHLHTEVAHRGQRRGGPAPMCNCTSAGASAPCGGHPSSHVGPHSRITSHCH